jgi:hypothetical protein
MDPETIRRIYICPVTFEEFPLETQDGMIEVYRCNDEINIVRSAILDRVTRLA